MFFGIDLPAYGEFADVGALAALAREAEAAGWDGFFLYDQVAPERPLPLADPWIALTAAALATSRLRLGTLVTPLPRRRPWKVARETVTLDHLSGGRLILGVGLGISPEEFDDLGEETDLRVRAEMLDEALTVLTGLWRGEPFSHLGIHYRVRAAHFLPAPSQTPRIPIWVGGTWPVRAPFRRAARWDGVFPHYRDEHGAISPMPPAVLREMLGYIAAHRAGAAPFAVVLRGATPGDHPERAAEMIAPYRDAGLTWWLEGVGSGRDLAAVRARIRQGPPGIQRHASVL
jgi:alkanesulfonate monooxygenase SsuD/methylene tetrahydromethanopterin reductase-like flavin-dependent oxidoreductase (luciferase family)